MRRLNWICGGLAALTVVAAHGEVQVRFNEPKGFSDLRDDMGFSRTDVLKDIEAHLVEQAGKRLPGKDLLIEVTDVDLAGEIEPWGRRGQWLRVMRSVTSPAMTLRYELREAGQVIRKAEVRLRDMDYLDAGGGMYASSDPLRYEYRMIDRWLDREFGRATASRP